MKKFKQIIKTLLVFVLAFVILFQATNMSNALSHYRAFTIQGIKVPLDGYSHEKVTFNNGYFQNASDFYVRSAAYDGEDLWDAVYCIEPGAPINQKDMTEDTNMSYMKDVPHKATTQKQKEQLLSAVFTYGENRGYVAVKDKDTATLNAWYAKYIATQLLLWEVITEDRGANFTYLNNKNSVVDLLDDFSASAKTAVLKHYDDYVSKITESFKAPDFGTSSTTLEFKDGVYTKTLTDKNKVIGNFTVTCSNPLINVTVDGNKVILLSELPVSENVKLNCTSKVKYNEVGYYIGKNNVETQAFGKALPTTNDSSMTTEVEFAKNVSGCIQVQKVSANEDFTKDNSSYSLQGAVFKISNADGVVKTITTNANGVASTGDVLPFDTYTIEEITAPKGYTLNNTKFTVVLSAESPVVNKVSIAQLTVSDEPKGGVIQILKVDSETNTTPQGGATLAGAVFVIKDSKGNIVDTIETNSDFIATSKLIPLGTYTVVETVAPKGYLLSDKVYTVVLSESEAAVTLKNMSVNNPVIKGSVVITKYKTAVLPNGIESFKSVFPNVKFTLKSLDTDEVFEPVSPRTDENGKIYFNNLPYGTYEIVEEIPDGYSASTPETIKITEDGAVVEVEIENVAISKTLKLAKETKHNINIEGISFEISGVTLDGQNIKFTLVTDGDGIATIVLPIGEYTVEELETEANVHYDIPEKQTVSLTEDTTVLFYNKEKRADISLKKYIQGTDFEYSLGEGIEFNLAGTSYAGYEVDMTIVTDTEGNAVFEDVPVGTYTLTEIANDKTEKLILLEPMSVEVKDNNTVMMELFNEIKTSSIVVTKTQATATDIFVADAEYTLFSADGKPITSLITDGKGQCTFVNVPFGEYYVKETAAPVGYKLNETAYPIKIEKHFEVIAIDTSDELILTDIVVSKQSKLTGEYLADTEFTLFDKTGEKIIAVAVTDETGFATFKNVPYGDYVIKETNPPIGYANDSEPVYFAVNDAFEEEEVFEFANSPLPQTGVDVTSISMLLCFIALLGCAVVLFGRVKHFAQNN